MTAASVPLISTVRLAANLNTLFQELPFEARARAAAACGFEALEVQFPYDHSAAAWQALITPTGLPLVLLNAPRGVHGEPGIAALADRRAEFADSIKMAADYASALACPLVHVLAGVGGDRACYLDNLALAAQLLAPVGAHVVIEVLNQVDLPGYHLQSTTDAQSVMAAVPGIGLQYDLYHSARAGESIAETLAGLSQLPAHVQISSCPSRHEPDEATMIGLAHVIRMGYRGFVGCEYWPASTTTDGLGWAGAFRIG